MCSCAVRARSRAVDEFRAESQTTATAGRHHRADPPRLQRRVRRAEDVRLQRRVEVGIARLRNVHLGLLALVPQRFGAFHRFEDGRVAGFVLVDAGAEIDLHRQDKRWCRFRKASRRSWGRDIRSMKRVEVSAYRPSSMEAHKDENAAGQGCSISVWSRFI